MRRLFLYVIPALTLTAGCGGSSPLNPSGTGATLTGSIVNGTGAGVSRAEFGPRAVPLAAGEGGQGLTVSVVGTDLSAPVNGANEFVLENVPPGGLRLRFTGGGVNAGLELSPVQGNEAIDIEVSVTADEVTLESERRSFGSEMQLEGRVESLPPTQPDGALIVAGQLVTTTPDTRFFKGGSSASFDDLLIGVRVHVKGQSDGSSLVASVIDIQNTKTDLPVNVNGVITAFTGDATAFDLTINGRLVKGDSNTEFFGNTVFADIAVGKRAEVKGLQQDGFVYARRLHISDEEDEDDQQESASIEGPLESMTGSGNLLTLVVDGVTVHTDESTVVQRKGDTQALSVLQLGMILHVVGTRQPDGSLAARRIQIKGDAVGGILEIEGSMGGLKGACPSVTFSVNGYSIRTDGATAFTPECSAFKSGNKVLVVGVVQSDGSVMATSVTK